MPKILMKVAVCSAVILATWMTTSSIIAQQKAGPRLDRPVQSSKNAAAIRKPTSAHRLVDSGRLDSTGQRPTGTVSGFASMHLTSHEITVAEGVATVKASVSIMDKRQGQLYIWRLRVVAPDGTPLAGMVYDQQMFPVEANGQKEVDFADTVPVPAGAKRVELVLYEKAPYEDLSFLDDRTTAKAHEVIRVAKRLT